MHKVTFQDIIGQHEMKKRLIALADAGRLPHALMLCGPDGCGKMAMAIALATYLLDKGTYKVRGIQHPDLHFTFPTIKLKKWNSEYKPVSEDFIQQWEEMLQNGPYFTLAEWMERMGAENQQSLIPVGEADSLIKRMMMRSNQGGWKVCIIWLPERMNLECANKILKLIEEPAPQTLFIMVCREPEKLLDTIRSRVQRYDMKRIDNEDVMLALMERRGLNGDDASRVARIANGNWLAAVEELNAGNENHLFFDYYITLMRKAYTKDLRELKRWSESVSTLGREQQRRLLAYFLRMTREAFMYNFHIRELSYMTSEEEEFCKKFARFVNEGNVIGFQDLFQKAQRDIGQNANAKIVFFDITMQVAVLLHTT